MQLRKLTSLLGATQSQAVEILRADIESLPFLTPQFVKLLFSKKRDPAALDALFDVGYDRLMHDR